MHTKMIAGILKPDEEGQKEDVEDRVRGFLCKLLSALEY